MNSFELVYTIDLPAETVWQKYFDEIDQWWTADFHTSPRTKQFKIEAYLGGKLYEDFGNGEGLVWGEVIGVDKPKSLQIRGMLSGEFGGPALSYEKYSFEEENGQTTLRFKTEFVGGVEEKTLKSLDSGWKTIFTDYFIPYCVK